uniref:Uncharacterized protein n=1 Tax=Anopheles coluzzii TaxID=1518534 RepID=A0A8W7PPY7_ANOCL
MKIFANPTPDSAPRKPVCGSVVGLRFTRIVDVLTVPAPIRLLTLLVLVAFLTPMLPPLPSPPGPPRRIPSWPMPPSGPLRVSSSPTPPPPPPPGTPLLPEPPLPPLPLLPPPPVPPPPPLILVGRCVVVIFVNANGAKLSRISVSIMRAICWKPDVDGAELPGAGMEREKRGKSCQFHSEWYGVCRIDSMLCIGTATSYSTCTSDRSRAGCELETVRDILYVLALEGLWCGTVLPVLPPVGPWRPPSAASSRLLPVPTCPWVGGSYGCGAYPCDGW